MRILFTSFPGLGHLHPLMPLALAAGAAGHDVRLASGPDMVDWTSRAGVTAYPVGCTQTVAAEAADLDFAGPRRTAHMFTDVWVSRALPDLVYLTANWSADARRDPLGPVRHPVLGRTGTLETHSDGVYGCAYQSSSDSWDWIVAVREPSDGDTPTTDGMDLGGPSAVKPVNGTRYTTIAAKARWRTAVWQGCRGGLHTLECQ